MTASVVVPSSSPLANLAFPRTGKRGVPQQFPRRLYEMLESERKAIEDHPETHNQVISWSDSGKAFRIFDVSEFAETILPKYFRTKKFSSFQRNLNLYGFAKIRRGPETDMYAHPSFVRDQPETLLQLRKLSTAARRQRLSSDDTSSGASSSSSVQKHTRAVSPSFSTDSPTSSPLRYETQFLHHPPVPSNLTIAHVESADEHSSASFVVHNNRCNIKQRSDCGKLDLLAMAIEHECGLNTI